MIAEPDYYDAQPDAVSFDYTMVDGTEVRVTARDAGLGIEIATQIEVVIDGRPTWSDHTIESESAYAEIEAIGRGMLGWPA